MPWHYADAFLAAARRHRHVALGLWLPTLCLAAYLAASASRDLSLYDSGELALAAVQLGVGHPPGQPLHTLLGHVASQLLTGSSLLAVCLLSAVPTALCLVPATRIALMLAPERPAVREARWVAWLIALFALHESIWEPASRVEVYALATLFGLWAIAHALPTSHATCEREHLLRRTWLSSVWLGLAASSNPVIAAASGIAITPLILRRALGLRALTACVLRALAGLALGLLPYLYLPLAATRSRVMIWGGLNDAASFARYLTLRDYARNQTLGLGGLLEHASAWCVWALQHLLAPTLILGLGGFVMARRHLPWSGAVFGFAFTLLLAMISFNVGWNLEVPDYNGYLALAYWLGAAGAAALFLDARRQRKPLACAGIVACLATSLLSQPTPWQRTRSEDRLARTLAEHVLREAPAGAIVIAYADYFAGSLFYLQEAERQRPDVVVLAYGLSGSSWHWRHLQALHPELVPIDLNKTGPRAQRVGAWLRENARPVLVEQLPLAALLGLRACPGGLYLRTGQLCDQPSPANETAPAQLLAGQLRQLGYGSPGAAGAIAQVSEELGSALWRLGAPKQAHDVLLAGVPKNAWPPHLADSSTLHAAQRLRAPAPVWQRPVALGDPARNLYLAGAVAAASGQAHVAQGYVAAAANLQLPEAQALTAPPR